MEEQEVSLKAQEDEVNAKQNELKDLRTQEMELELSVSNMKKRIDQITQTQQDTQLYISQVSNLVIFIIIIG